GRQALAQVQAVAQVRAVDHIRIASRVPEHREAFARRVRDLELGCSVTVHDTIESAVCDAEIVTTVTRAQEAILRADMLAPCVHVNAIGAITPERRELADD